MVLVNSEVSPDSVFVANLTSKKKSNEVYGCYLDVYPSCFFLPSTETELNKDSWVMLNKIYEYDYPTLSGWKKICELNLQQTKDVILCGSESLFVDNWIRDELKKIGELIQP